MHRLQKVKITPGLHHQRILFVFRAAEQVIAGNCMQAVKMLARLHHQMGSPERATQVLEQQVQAFPEATDLTHINILAELFMDAGKHEQAASLIRQAEHLPCMQHGVPIDLRVSTLVSHCCRSCVCVCAWG